LTRPSNLMPTVCDIGTGADKSCVDNGVPGKQCGEIRENGFAGANGVPDKNCVDCKFRRQKGSEVLGSVDGYIAAEALACTSNWGPTVSEEWIRADEKLC